MERNLFFAKIIRTRAIYVNARMDPELIWVVCKKENKRAGGMAGISSYKSSFRLLSISTNRKMAPMEMAESAMLKAGQ